MGSFKRAILGYRRPEVDAAISARDTRIATRDARIDELSQELEAKAEIESEVASLSGMVIEREREIRSLNEQLREANERHDRSIASLDAVSARLHEIEAQARGQATRIRMKALREAVEVSQRAQELSKATATWPIEETEVEEAGPEEITTAGFDELDDAHDEIVPPALFEGMIKLEIGPLGDYSQLVGIEDTMGQLGAREVSVERFSEGRATLSMEFGEPVDLLRELEERSPMEFHVRRAADDNLILDVDEDAGPGHRAA